MSGYRAVLFDADGVAVIPPRLFSSVYAEQAGIPEAQLTPFYREEFSQALEGKVDLKTLITKYRSLWQWDGDPQILLDNWFATENHPNQEVLRTIASVRLRGTPVFLATNQEKYRARYIREVMFPEIFDDYFISSELGILKSDPEFFRAILAKLSLILPALQPREVIYFDDSPHHVASAAQAGINAHLYTHPNQVVEALSAG